MKSIKSVAALGLVLASLFGASAHAATQNAQCNGSPETCNVYFGR